MINFCIISECKKQKQYSEFHKIKTNGQSGGSFASQKEKKERNKQRSKKSDQTDF